MLDPETFLTALYVAVDDFCKEHLPEEAVRHGRTPSLCRSEVVTLALFGQWNVFASERAFYRYADHHLRGAFPNLPSHAQFNRLVRHHTGTMIAFLRHLAKALGQGTTAYEAIDTLPAPTRNAKRRGVGWLPGYADLGFSRRIGYYCGFHVLRSVTQDGVITGFDFGPASAKDQPLAEAFFAARHTPIKELACVGEKAQAPYLGDSGFQGAPNHRHWHDDYGATVLCKPQGEKGRSLPKRFRHRIASLRQIVETVNGALIYTYGLWHERSHEIDGFFARLAARMTLHNACIFINRSFGRPNLAFSDLIDW